MIFKKVNKKWNLFLSDWQIVPVNGSGNERIDCREREIALLSIYITQEPALHSPINFLVRDRSFKNEFHGNLH